MEVDDQTTILEASNTLKCVLMVGTFKGEALSWYLGLPRASILWYPYLVRKMIKYFPIGQHRETTAINPLSNLSGDSGTPGTIRLISIKVLFITPRFPNMESRMVTLKDHRGKGQFLTQKKQQTRPTIMS